MQTHRFKHLLSRMAREEARATAPTAGAFLICPIPLAGRAEDQSFLSQLYRMAFEQAQAVVRASWLESDPLADWN